MSAKKIYKTGQELVTFKDIANTLGITTMTLWRKTKHLRPIIYEKGKRKRLYKPEEVKLLINNLK